MADPPRRGGTNTTSSKPKATTGSRTSAQATRADSKAVVPRNAGTVATQRPNHQRQGQTMLAPKGYTMRAIQPAKNYDVVSFARAMNDDFGPRVKKLFDPEREAALAAQETGVYIGWRCPEYNWDCQRVGRSSRCFCGHVLGEHSEYNGRSVRVPCRASGCTCKAFAWVPSRPEDVGEFWLPKRRDFDPAAYRAMCRCKHTHEDHDPNGMHRCRKCGCAQFSSSSVCAACDRHWEAHETFFDDEKSRREKGLPVGADYLPFAEIPSLRNMVLTGEDDGDMSYMRLQERTLAQGALPPSRSHGNADMVQYRGGGIDGDRGQRGGYGGGGREDQRRYDRRGGGVDDYDDDYGAQRPRDDVRNVEPKRGGYDSYYDEDAAAGSRGGGGGGSRHPQQRYRDEREYDDDDGVPFDDRVVPSSRRYDNTSYESAAGGRAARDAGYEYGRGGTTGYGGTRSGQSSRR